MQSNSPGLPSIRPTWDDTWLGAARVLSSRSLCSRAQVGAIIVDEQHRVLASCYNGPPRSFPHNNDRCVAWCHRAAGAPGTRDPDYDDCPALHAEANAISASEYAARQRGTIYVTSHVCFGCAKLIANSGLARLVVAPDDEAAWRRPDRSYDLLRQCGLEVDIYAA